MAEILYYLIVAVIILALIPLVPKLICLRIRALRLLVLNDT